MSDHASSVNVNRLVDSYSAGLIHGVSRGDFITQKHFLLGLGLHNLTGRKNVIQITSRLGHTISYGKTCEIELAQAQKVQELATQSSALPLKPATEDDFVLTVFWVDNFDMKVESQGGGGTINITHLMAFQEVTDRTTVSIKQTECTKRKEATDSK